jgi:hypothetical protein
MHRLLEKYVVHFSPTGQSLSSSHAQKTSVMSEQPWLHVPYPAIREIPSPWLMQHPCCFEISQSWYPYDGTWSSTGHRTKPGVASCPLSELVAPPEDASPGVVPPYEASPEVVSCVEARPPLDVAPSAVG